MRSARLLLLLAAIGISSLVSLVAATFSYREGRLEAAELFDAKLAHSARVLSALIAPHLGDLREGGNAPPLIEVWHGAAAGRGEALVSASGHAYETKLAFQVRDAEGVVRLRSDSGPALPLAPLREGFSDGRFDGKDWRVFTLRSPDGHWVHAGEQEDIRAELAEGIAFGTLMPTLVALPVLALALAMLVHWASRGLRRIVEQVERRAGDHLQPIDPESVPQEMAGLVRSINGLLSRVAKVLDRERQFTADAAHELKTPLAALRVQLANAREASSEAERERTFARLEQGLSRMDRLIAQLLDLAREEAVPSAPAPPATRVDLSALVRREVAELGLAGLHRGITIDVVGLEHAPVHGESMALGVMVRNLIDNAFRYTPDDGAVRVELRGHGGRTVLTVDDSGPGIPPEARERVFGRFHRELGQGVAGSGLGLAIVQSVVEKHQGRITLGDSPWGGLRVEVDLPA